MSNSDSEKWEFGSHDWCNFAAGLGVKLLQASNLNLNSFAWGFSEEYLSIPDRLLGNRELAGYHLIINDGQVTGGTGIPETCLELTGFHVAIEWAMIAHSSYLPFNNVGHQERGMAHIRLRRELHAIGVGDGKWVLEHTIPNAEKTGEMCRACGSALHKRSECMVWPLGIGEALGANPDAAAHKWRLKRSAELEEFPESELGVPLFHEMSHQQKLRFLNLMGVTEHKLLDGSAANRG